MFDTCYVVSQLFFLGYMQVFFFFRTQEWVQTTAGASHGESSCSQRFQYIYWTLTYNSNIRLFSYRWWWVKWFLVVSCSIVNIHVSVGVSAGRCPHHRLTSFVEVLSSLQAAQEASESSTFEVSPQLTLSANSSALKSSSLWTEQKAGLTRLRLCVLNIHQRLSHLTLRSLSLWGLAILQSYTSISPARFCPEPFSIMWVRRAQMH